MLYETAGRAEELLPFDVADLDTANRCETITRKGGAKDVIAWQTGPGRYARPSGEALMAWQAPTDSAARRTARRA
ncbi:hypothetical protein ACPESR_17730 [Nocardia testacea]|uniref:hypothetical protein n=1 Tax=Nocardia testacea TaxID=248551 RepID=UPI003C2CCF78